MNIQKYSLFIAWLQSIIATLVSLFFSEILNLTPCKLCWYQRMCIYPLVIILGISMLKKDRSVYMYALPLSILGLIFAFYHNLLTYWSIPQINILCAAEDLCSTPQVKWFGFITMPLLSLMAFTVINLCLWSVRRNIHKSQAAE